MDIREQYRELETQLEEIPEKALISQYVVSLNKMLSQKDGLFDRDFLPIIREEKKLMGDSPRPFLSVLTRTQGKRPEMLRETLLSLSAQTDMDFEVLLIGHNLDEEKSKMVENIIFEQGDELRGKIRFMKLDYGNRTAPLNFGFAHAHGDYISILDDDDVVFDNWVEEFHKAAKDSDGMILHAFVSRQDWMCVRMENGREALRAVNAPTADYCVSFDLLEQLSNNHCPTMGLAFPAYWFQNRGFIFDEQLTTTEDWDYLMRVAFLAGVHDIKTNTALYRWWSNAESSSTLHKSDEWNKNYIRIQEKWENIPIMMSGNRKLLFTERNGEAAKGGSRPRISVSTLFFDAGNGFNETNKLLERALSNGEIFDVEFDMTELIGKQIKQIRFDVCEEGLFVITDVIAMIRYTDGEKENRALKDCSTNGVWLEDSICFVKNDPQIIWQVDPKKSIEKVRIIGSVHSNLPKGMENLMSGNVADMAFQLFYGEDLSLISEDASMRGAACYGDFQLTFNMKNDENISYVRLDPGDETNCVLKDLMVELVGENGDVVQTLSITDAASTNGIIEKKENMIIFTDEDPKILFSFSAKKLAAVKVRGFFEKLTPLALTVGEILNRANNKKPGRLFKH